MAPVARAVAWETTVMTGLPAAILALLAVLAMPALPALAQGSPTANDDGRFTLHRTEDGYLRLDGRTGQVSACARRDGTWACDVVPDERGLAAAEIARLAAENAALKNELQSRNLPLPGGAAPEPSAKVEQPRLRPLREPELKRMMTTIEKVWRRMVEMILEMQKDLTQEM
jgi:hypothetical protein